ncbi:MAG: FxLYD domain-containing protein, partial [Chloroflexota bacterium]|nr:FxLYD domain-containing protein [Chloroflexota bacterium]
EDSFDITFLEETSYYDSDDYFHLVGELQNDSDINLNIAIIAAFYDIDGNVLDADNLSMMPISSLAPGETVTYDISNWKSLNNNEGLFDTVDNYSVQWDPGWTWDTSARYVDIATIDEGSEYDEFWGTTFTGNVENDSGENLAGAVVIVNLYDPESGALLAMGYETIFDEIPDGEVTDYEVIVPVEADFDLDAVEHTIIAKGKMP